MPFRVGRDDRPERHAALSSPPEGRRAVGVAEPDAAPLGDRQRLPRTPRDRLALLLRHQRHDADGEVVRLRQIDRGEPNAAVAQREEEGGVARELVELGHHQRRVQAGAAATFLRVRSLP